MATDANHTRMARSVKLPDTIVEKAQEIGEERDMTIKEAVRYMCQEGGFDV